MREDLGQSKNSIPSLGCVPAEGGCLVLFVSESWWACGHFLLTFLGNWGVGGRIVGTGGLYFFFIAFPGMAWDVKKGFGILILSASVISSCSASINGGSDELLRDPARLLVCPSLLLSRPEFQYLTLLLVHSLHPSQAQAVTGENPANISKTAMGE